MDSEHRMPDAPSPNELRVDRCNLGGVATDTTELEPHRQPFVYRRIKPLLSAFERRDVDVVTRPLTKNIEDNT
jgi:hypothetical protein